MTWLGSHLYPYERKSDDPKPFVYIHTSHVAAQKLHGSPLLKCVCICHVCFPEQFDGIHKVGSTSTISGDIRPCKAMCMCTTPSLWRFNSAMNIYKDVCKVVSSSMAQEIKKSIEGWI